MKDSRSTILGIKRPPSIGSFMVRTYIRKICLKLLPRVYIYSCYYYMTLYI